ncbi:MAG: ABC transporter permease [Candidatus Acidiferrales bacterium]
MRILRAWFSRAAGLFHKERRDRELADEIESNLRMHIDDNVRAGMRPAEARRQALLKFGSVESAKESYREQRGIPLLETLWQDVHFGLRMLRKSASFTIVAVLTLALGVGVNATVFSWVRALLLNPLPGVVAANHVVALETLTPDGSWEPTSYLDFRDLRDNCKPVEAMSVTKPMALAVGDRESVERVWGEAVSGNFFEMLGVKPALGRFFSAGEVDLQQNAHPLVIISHSYWVSHYHADPGVIGATVRINHFPYTVIGVTPEEFHGSMPGLSFDAWVPATMYGQLASTGDNTLLDRKWRTFRVLARLAPGVSIGEARAEVESHAKDMARDDASTSEGMSATLLPMWESHYGIQGSMLGPLSILMTACGLVLLIVCANLANLELARATARQKEFVLRLALGASRARLIRQVLTECSLVAAAGSLGGIAIASWLKGTLGWFLPRSSVPALGHVLLDIGVLFFAITLAFAVALVAGLAAALRVAGRKADEMLKTGGRASSSAHSNRLRGLLATSEMALAVVAMIAAGLLLESFRNVSKIRPGFDAQHVAVAQLDLSAASYNAQQANNFYQRLQQKLERQPGVTAVSYADYVPLSFSRGSWEKLQIRGYIPAPSEDMDIYRSLISPGYFNLMKISIFEGRDFRSSDDMEAPPVLIVNQEFVRRFIGTGTALGRQVHGWGSWFTIVGVVADSKVFRLTERPAPYFYVPMRQIYRPEMGLLFFVRTAASDDSAISMLQNEARAADPTIPVFDVMSLNDEISVSLFTQRISAGLVSVLGGVALLLAALGLFGVIAYSVAQRTNEFGIRIALGAQRKHVFAMVLGQGTRVALLGIAIGTLAAWTVTRLMIGTLYGVKPGDPLIFCTVSLLLLAVAILACYVPARRAMRVDPMVALKYE